MPAMPKHANTFQTIAEVSEAVCMTIGDREFAKVDKKVLGNREHNSISENFAEIEANRLQVIQLYLNAGWQYVGVFSIPVTDSAGRIRRTNVYLHFTRAPKGGW